MAASMSADNIAKPDHNFVDSSTYLHISPRKSSIVFLDRSRPPKLAWIFIANTDVVPR